MFVFRHALCVFLGLCSGWASAAEPTLTLRYSVAFDLVGALESAACSTGLCDCEVAYEGTGVRVSTGKGVETYEGTFALVSGACHEQLTFWVPEDGKAFHTLRFAKDGTTLTEWIGHGKKADTKRFEDSMKAKQQVWLAELDAPRQDAAPTYAHTENEAQKAGPFEIRSVHTLEITLK